jgi:hypothetical protein
MVTLKVVTLKMDGNYRQKVFKSQGVLEKNQKKLLFYQVHTTIQARIPIRNRLNEDTSCPKRDQNKRR